MASQGWLSSFCSSWFVIASKRNEKSTIGPSLLVACPRWWWDQNCSTAAVTSQWHWDQAAKAGSKPSNAPPPLDNYAFFMEQAQLFLAAPSACLSAVTDTPQQLQRCAAQSDAFFLRSKLHSVQWRLLQGTWGCNHSFSRHFPEGLFIWTTAVLLMTNSLWKS